MNQSIHPITVRPFHAVSLLRPYAEAEPAPAASTTNRALPLELSIKRNFDVKWTPLTANIQDIANAYTSRVRTRSKHIYRPDNIKIDF
jgi:hypothetical protein